MNRIDDEIVIRFALNRIIGTVGLGAALYGAKKGCRSCMQQAEELLTAYGYQLVWVGLRRTDRRHAASLRAAESMPY